MTLKYPESGQHGMYAQDNLDKVVIQYSLEVY